MQNKKLKYYIWVLGCQMNKSDSERVASVLGGLGYERTEQEKLADLIVVMACSVRQSAIDRIFGKVKKWNLIKRKREFKIILSGCVLDKDKPKMEKIFDFIFDISELSKLPLLLSGNKELNFDDYFKIKPFYESSFSAFVPIMTGCDNFCTYCAVPYTKGRERSRLKKEIIKEVFDLIKKGYKEITLLGQNVNSYQNSKTKDQKSKNQFAQLLREVNAIPGDFWIRFLTSNPHDMSDEIIDAFSDCEKICDYIHLPIQSGNNEVLKNMNRKYTKEHYLNLIKKIRNKIPRVAISTDTIVGFPGETKKQFKDSVDVYKEVGYDMAYIAQYSPRTGTVSFNMRDNVKKEEKIRRDKELNKILEKTALKNNKNYIDRTVDVLVENEKKGYLLGRTRTFKLVRFKGSKKLLGNFVKIKIFSVTPWAMEGVVIKK